MGLDEAYADLTGVEKPLRVLRELIDEVHEADRDPDLGRRRAQPPDRQVLLGPRQARRLRRHGPRGGVHPLRHRADPPAARHRPEDRRAPGGARLRDRRPAPGGRRGPARRPLRRPHRPLPEGARDLPRRLAGRDRGRRRQVGLHRAHLRRGHRLPRGARDDPAHALPASSARACSASRARAARSRSRSASPTGRRSPAPARCRTRPTTPRSSPRPRWSCCAPTRRPSPCACSACGSRPSTTSSRTSPRRRSRRSASCALPL